MFGPFIQVNDRRTFAYDNLLIRRHRRRCVTKNVGGFFFHLYVACSSVLWPTNHDFTDESHNLQVTDENYKDNDCWLMHSTVNVPKLNIDVQSPFSRH